MNILANLSKKKIMTAALLVPVLFLIFSIPVQAVHLSQDQTMNDSTQPRGAPLGIYNSQGQLLDHIDTGFMSPAYRASVNGDTREEFYPHWAGMTMANAMRDPAFDATLSVANKNVIDLIYAAAAYGLDEYNPDLENLTGLKTAREAVCFLKLYVPAEDDTNPDPCIPGNPITLLDEDVLPVTADMCLRCHTPVGWMEGRSEPPTPHFDYLRGQFWGANFVDIPDVDVTQESQSELDGIQCDFCHRTNDNFKRNSLYDNSIMANGIGGFFVYLNDPFGRGGAVEVTNDFQAQAVFCGTCHDVTNPVIKTQNTLPADIIEMQHPIERTYTEWYWSDYRDSEICQDCHQPMKFQAAQTWLLYPGLHNLWGDKMDQQWVDQGYPVSASREQEYMNAMTRNTDFMKTSANLQFVDTPQSITPGDVTVNVKVTNKAGHKLPTGFAEGRQMWIHIKAVDDVSGDTIFEDGILDPVSHELIRTPETKVYEQVVLAKGYENFKLDGNSIIDANKDGYVSHYEKEFHFVLMNYIEKDNRIPPKGFNKAAYEDDGAFIIPRDAKDTDYPNGQNWDTTPYTFNFNPTTGGTGRSTISVTATLYYQTFNTEYIEFLKETDNEPTLANGGRARNIPTGGSYSGFTTWGTALDQIYTDANYGPPVEIATKTVKIQYV
ncbi:MAG: hypothetical protein E4G94_03965 [ANME-2 cluster archaeon]|nr:MAG: hypothetical protein E4G94_03965 [ANME-2 cluster archaeon]